MKKMFLVILIGIVLIVFLFISVKEFFVDKINFTKSGFPEFQGKVNQLLKKYNVPGTAIALIDDGKIYNIFAFGWMNKKNKIPMTKNNLFQVASNSKTVTAWGIMKLVDEGRIELDLPIEKYLKSWHLPVGKFDNNEVTIKRVLSHTAGLSLGNYHGYLPGTKIPTLVESLSGIGIGQKELRVIIKPGTRFKYSGGGYTLLQILIQDITGMSFDEYMKKDILNKLGMTSSSFDYNADIKNKISISYDIFGNQLPGYIYTEKAAAGLYTTAGDFAQFVISNINVFNEKNGEDNLITKQSLEMMYTPNKKYYGFGYLIRKLKDNSSFIYHGGTNRGWRSQFVILPEKKQGIVILTNSDNGKHFYTDIIRMWAKSRIGYVPLVFNLLILYRIIVWLISLLMICYLIIIFYYFLVNLKSNNLKFVLNNFNRHCLSAIIKIFLIIIAGILWYFIFYIGFIYNRWIIASLIPYGFNFLSVIFYLLSVFFIIFSCFTKKVTLDKN